MPVFVSQTAYCKPYYILNIWRTVGSTVPVLSLYCILVLVWYEYSIDCVKQTQKNSRNRNRNRLVDSYEYKKLISVVSYSKQAVQ